MDSLSMTGSSYDTAAIAGVLAGAGIAVGITCLVLAIIMIIAMWKVFQKAGEAGWKAIIPIYNNYITFKIADRNFWVWFLTLIGGNVCSNLANGTEGAVAIILSLASLVLSIWALVEAIRMCHGLSKNFGHGVGFTLGLIFLSFIFWLILGFGSSQYKANGQQSQE